MKTYHVSGHLDLSEEEFFDHYISPIVEAILFNLEVRFVVGDARGTDQLFRNYARKCGLDVTVYHMFEKPRGTAWVGEKYIGGFKTDTERDEAMTLASDEDIAWVRPERRGKGSGTEKNLLRRKNLK